jgi:hypothetical protein
MRNDMATLKHFLQTGELGPLRPGMSEADVVEVLGPPSDESVARHPKILKYGGLQLTFVRDPGAQSMRLEHVGLYYRQPVEPIPGPARPADFNGTPETTLSEVRDFLARMGVQEYEVDESEDASYLILPSGVRFTFDGQKLWSINFVSRRPAPNAKQISVSLPTDTWNRLRQRARASDRSVAELCAEWIKQRVDALNQECVTPPVPAR